MQMPLEKSFVAEFWVFFMLSSNVFTVNLYFVFCMFVLIRPIFVSTVCEVFSTLRAGDTQGKSYYDTVICYHTSTVGTQARA